jgi:cholesterol 7-dehydrogenase
LIPCEVSHLQLRAESVNFVRCHIQEIPENGADIKHFSYVHTSALDILYPFIKLEWDMKTKNAADPDFYEVMTHPLAKYRIHQNNLYDQFLKDKS